MASQPAVVLVPGAWHSPVHFASVTSALEAEGYEVSAVKLCSVAPTVVQDALAKDVAVIKQAISRLTDAGKNVVVVMHSYGGVCGSEAVAEVCEEQLRAGSTNKGRIVHLVYISAFILAKGMSASDARSGAHITDFHEELAYHLEPYHRFYNLTPTHLARRAIGQLLPISAEVFVTPTKYEGWKDYNIPLTFVFCEQDNAFPKDPDIKNMAKRLEDAHLAEYNRVSIDSDHSPWLSKPEEFMASLRNVLNRSICQN